MTSRLLHLLHLCDSLFPIGAFAHSDGLETATASGAVATAEEFRAWLTGVRDHSLATLEAPAVSRAWLASHSGRDADVHVLDGEAHALRPSASAREASRTMGGRLVRTWASLHPESEGGLTRRFPDPLTLPVAFGIVSQCADVDRRSAVAGYVYTRLAASLSAAMRLMPLGQQQGHRILTDVLRGSDAVVEHAMCEDMPLRAFAPAFDIAAMNHQHVFSRLFLS